MLETACVVAAGIILGYLWGLEYAEFRLKQKIEELDAEVNFYRSKPNQYIYEKRGE